MHSTDDLLYLRDNRCNARIRCRVCGGPFVSRLRGVVCRRCRGRLRDLPSSVEDDLRMAVGDEVAEEYLERSWR